MTGHAVDHARADERLYDLHPRHGVYAAIPPAYLGADARILAAVLATDRRGVVGIGTAAHRWRLVPAAPREVTLISRLHLAPPPGVTVRRTVLRPGDVVRDDAGFRVTTPTRTLLDLAVGSGRGALVRALAEAEFHHGLTPRDVLAVLRRGHPGSARLRTALDLHVPGYGAMHSRLERRFRTLLIRHGVELPRRQVRLGRWTVDCLWPELRVVVELDGGQHERPGQAAVDAARDLWLRRNGYVVRRYTWAQIAGPGAVDVITDLFDAFAEARARRAERRTW